MRPSGKKTTNRAGASAAEKRQQGKSASAGIEFEERVRDLEAALHLQSERATRAGAEGERFRLLLESQPEAVCLCGPEGMVGYANTACAALLGLRPRDMVGRSLGGLLAGCGCDQARYLLACPPGEGFVVLELPAQERMVEFSRVALPRGDLLLVGRDVTDRSRRETALRRAKERAEIADRAKDEFLANVSHELRTPISAIIGMAECLQEARDSAVQADFTEKIKDCAQSLLSVISDILDYSSLTRDKLELDAAPFVPAVFADEVLAPLRARARAKGLDFALEVAPATPATLMGDVRRLGKVLTHLVANAVTFTDQGSVRVRVAPDARPGWIRFSVYDTGVGIARDKLDMIFDDFTQTEQGLSKRYPGLGLGLAVCRGLVRLMGGEIEVSSRPGEGSCFSFSLPAARGAASPAARPLSAFRPLDILHVEDNELNREFMDMLLSRAGHRVDDAFNGFEALDKLAAKRYDLVIMDVQLPGMDGVEAVRRIRAGEVPGLDPNLPVVALTAFATQGDRERLLREGMTDYLEKPVDRKRLEGLLIDLSGRESRIRESSPMFGGDTVNGAKLLALFKEQAPNSMAEIDAALECGDMDMAARRAHYLAGSALAVGNRDLAGLAKDMVASAKKGDKATCGKCWAALRQGFDVFLRSLSGLKAGH